MPPNAFLLTDLTKSKKLFLVYYCLRIIFLFFCTYLEFLV